MERLYVLVRKDIPVGYQAVQAGHAVAEHMLKEPDDRWKNDYLIYLNVKDERSLLNWHYDLSENGYKPVIFCEPDINHEATALAVNAPRELFSKLKLMGSQ